MTKLEQMEAWFETHEDEFCNFRKLSESPIKRSDLRAFMLLSLLDPENTSDVIAAVEYEYAWLGVDPEVVAETITEEQVIELLRCGVIWDTSHDSFGMHV